VLVEQKIKPGIICKVGVQSVGSPTNLVERERDIGSLLTPKQAFRISARIKQMRAVFLPAKVK